VAYRAIRPQPFGVPSYGYQLGFARFRETGSFERDQVGGYRPKKMCGDRTAIWLLQRCRRQISPCAGWWRNSPSGALKVDYPHGVAVCFTREAQSKKDAIAADQ